MNLAIDIGNTRIKAALFDGETLTEPFSSEEPLSLKLVRFWLKNQIINRIIISSVRQLDPMALEEIKEVFSVLVLNQHTPLPINVLYESRDTLGLDRICLAVAAHDLFPENPVLAIDAGTCITYEVIDGQGNYLGGAISPGISMRAKALNQFTAKLPLVVPEPMELSIGTTTQSSIQMGTVVAARFEVLGFIRHFQKQFENLKVILTGGDSSFFEQHVENAIFAAPNLVLQGLNKILLYNKLAQ